MINHYIHATTELNVFSSTSELHEKLMTAFLVDCRGLAVKSQQSIGYSVVALIYLIIQYNHNTVE